MVVEQSKCIGCGVCTIYCPADAIKIIRDQEGKRKAWIDQSACLECGTCIRKRVVKCPRDALYELPKEERPIGRQMRRFFSDPSTTHPLTGVPGRGTAVESLAYVWSWDDLFWAHLCERLKKQPCFWPVMV